MNNPPEPTATLQAGQSVLQMTLQVTRAATGLVEEYILDATPVPETTKDE